MLTRRVSSPAGLRRGHRDGGRRAERGPQAHHSEPHGRPHGGLRDHRGESGDEPRLHVARHTHFGIETSYVVEGELELAIDGMGSKTYKAGDGFQVPTGAIHGGKTGDKPVTLAGIYVVEKGKPLATPA